MKRLVITAAAFAFSIAAPVISIAQQTNGPLTRAQVRDELRCLEDAGYNPAAGDDPKYPEDIQKALARVQIRQGQSSGTSGLGGATSGASQSGGPTPVQPGGTEIYKCQ